MRRDGCETVPEDPERCSGRFLINLCTVFIASFHKQNLPVSIFDLDLIHFLDFNRSFFIIHKV